MKVKLSQVNGVLGIVGGLFLAVFLFKQPVFLLYSAVMILPGFLLSYFFSEKEFSFLERLSLAIVLSNLMLISLRWMSLLAIPLSKTLLFSVGFFIPLLIGITRFRLVLGDIKNSLGEGRKDYSKIAYSLFVVALAVFLVWLVWGSLLQGTKLPLTDQVVQFSWITTYKSTIENYQRYPYWLSEYSGGFPFSIFEASLYYERLAFNWMLMPGYNLTFHINCYSFLNLVLLLLGIYCLAKRLGWGRIAAMFSMVLFIASPLLGSKLGYSGDMKEMTSFVIAPLMIIVFFLMMDKRELRYYLLMGMLVAVYYFTNLVPLIPMLMMLALLFIFYKMFNGKAFGRKEIVGIGVLGISVLLLIGFNLIPLFFSLSYGTPDAWNVRFVPKIFFESIIKPFFSEPLRQQYTHNMGLLFSLAAVLGMILSLRKFKKNENYLLLAFWLTLFCYIIPMLNLPLIHVENHRFLLLILMIFSLFISRLLELSERAEVKIGAVVLFVAILALYLPLAMTQARDWVGEQAQNGMFEGLYREMDKLGPGRVINYGIFAYATEPLIPVESNSLWMITHTTGSGARTTPQYELKDGSESALNKEYNITYIINRLRTTFTRYIIVVKDPGREGDITYAILKNYLQNSSLAFDTTQLAVFVVPDSYYIQSVIPAKTTLSKKEIYSNAEGWKLFSFATQKADREYGMVVNAVENIHKLPYPAVYNYEIVSPGELNIYGNFTGEWIVVKDHYFPTWHAEMDGKELRIEESNLGTLLIKTEKGEKIHLFHKPFWYERPIALVSFGALLLAFFISEIVMLKGSYSKKEGSNP